MRKREWNYLDKEIGKGLRILTVAGLIKDKRNITNISKLSN